MSAVVIDAVAIGRAPLRRVGGSEPHFSICAAFQGFDLGTSARMRAGLILGVTLDRGD